MARLNLNVADLRVESFPLGPQASTDDRYGSSEWCDTADDCSTACLAATNVCRVC